MEVIVICLNIIVLNNFSDKISIGIWVRSKIKCTATENHKILTITTKPDRSNRKPQNHKSFWKTTSSGNSVLNISG